LSWTCKSQHRRARTRYTMKDTPEAEFYELQRLVDAGKEHLKRTDLTKDQRNLLVEIVRGSNQLLKGQSSEGTWISEERFDSISDVTSE
jgi:hypothetical protein